MLETKIRRVTVQIKRRGGVFMLRAGVKAGPVMLGAKRFRFLRGGLEAAVEALRAGSGSVTDMDGTEFAVLQDSAGIKCSMGDNAVVLSPTEQRQMIDLGERALTEL